MPEYYIGLMSGTSLDGIDAVLVDLAETMPSTLSSRFHPLPEALRKRLLSLTLPGEDELERQAQLDVLMGRELAMAVIELLERSDIPNASVQAIGSHGQTVRHRPSYDPPFTVQIGDPNTIAELTGITTVADFRRRDMAAGGEGAPLVPAFHAACLGDTQQERVILNIGGMANVTLLPAGTRGSVSGFDTGPGNVLLNSWAEKWLRQPMDRDGAWGRSGTVDNRLLQQLLSEPYFEKAPPKSTGREQFNLAWLEPALTGSETPEDVQATLVELTATTISRAIQEHAASTAQIIACGGGVHNPLLMERLAVLLGRTIENSGRFGLEPDWVEATAFAWLAKQTLNGLPGNIPAVTGARKTVVLGGIYPGKGYGSSS